MKRVSVFLILTGIFCLAPFAFTKDAVSPFVSRLRAIPGENTIKIVWSDSKDAVSMYHIYRSVDKIVENNFQKAEEIGKVPPGKGIFIDVPTQKKLYFYAVLASGPKGNLYKLFIPYRNITVKGVEVKHLAPYKEIAAKITKIKTQVMDKNIKVTFSSSKPDREVFIYRSTYPLQDYGDLSHSVLAGKIQSASGTFMDNPVAGVSYYYGIFDAEFAKASKFTFIPGENTTITSIEIPVTNLNNLTEKNRNSRRPPPLPFLEVSKDIETGNSLKRIDINYPKYHPLNDKTETIYKNITSSMKDPVPPFPKIYIFPVDRKAKENSETYPLVRILNTDFSSKAWAQAYKLLGNFLSVRHTKEVERRTHFYLGEVLYNLGKYRESFMEFTLVENNFYMETHVWLDSLYSRLRNNMVNKESSDL